MEQLKLVGQAQNIQTSASDCFASMPSTSASCCFTLAFFLILWLISKSLRAFAHFIGGWAGRRGAFWTRQGLSLITFFLGLLGFVSIWFDNPARLATGLGLVGVGLAFALQKVITSFAGYFVILRGKTFNVGDRITMGGVRGDVVALNFIQTVIMEMGQPPSVQGSDAEMWVQSRQYTGRVVTVTNSKIFEEPVYNYTRDFPFLWEEMHIPISYSADMARAEMILLEAASGETVKIEELAQPTLKILDEKYAIKSADISPRVFVRLTDNWVELTVRFLCRDHDIRGLKDV